MATLLDGWNCGNCKIFNGSVKEWLSVCRSCGQPGPSKSITKVPAPMTYEDVVQGCKNIGYDLNCGQCASAPNAVAEASPAPADEVPSPAEESGKSAIDDLIREAEGAIVSEATVARPLPLLIAKLLREFKGERATCLLQRATIKDLRAKLEQTSKEWFLTIGPEDPLWKMLPALTTGLEPASNMPRFVRLLPSAQISQEHIEEVRAYYEKHGADVQVILPQAPAANSAKEEPFLTILNSEPRITELLLSSGVLLSSGDIHDRLYALDNDGHVWTMVVASDSSCEWSRLPPIKESKGKRS